MSVVRGVQGGHGRRQEKHKPERRRSRREQEQDREDGLRRQEAASPRNETAAVHSASFRSSSAPVAGTRHREARRGIVMLRYADDRGGRRSQ